MASLSLLEETDQENRPKTSYLTRVSERVFGDPRKAPKRIALLLVFALFGFISIGVWAVSNAQFETAGSSSPVVGPVLNVLTSVWLIPVLALLLTRNWVFFNRRRKAGLAASISGWSVETINHLRDEIQSTDGCTRVIASTEDSKASIAHRIRAALEGELEDEYVEYWDTDEYDDDEPATETEGTLSVDEIPPEVARESVTDAERDALTLRSALEREGFTQFAAEESGSTSRWPRPSREFTINAVTFALSGLAGGLTTALALDPDQSIATVALAILGGVAFGSLVTMLVHQYQTRPRPDPAHTSEDDGPNRDAQLPWKARFLEEVKHLWLDLQSGFRTGDVLVKFGVPAGVTFVAQLFLVGLWTTPPVYLLFVATSSAVGLTWFWILKRRRQRRLKRYRSETTDEFWLDCAGQFKTVETPDVTAYMGFIAGRRYASYDREEFVRKTARTMHQHVSDDCVAPSDLEHYARCLAQMEPNLKGHRDNVLRPLIMRALDNAVHDADDEITPKAELAWSVIEQPTSSKIERRLGHDPELVSEAYRFLVEDAHALDERDVQVTDASGTTQTITLVFPAEKRRLPDVSERHSQFSDRFTDKKGQPVYELPEVDPRDELYGFVPSPEASARFNGAVPAGGGD